MNRYKAIVAVEELRFRAQSDGRAAVRGIRMARALLAKLRPHRGRVVIEILDDWGKRVAFVDSRGQIRAERPS